MDQLTLWLSLLTLLSLVVLAVSALTLYKTRKVHLATFPLLQDLAATRRETEALFGQIHALLALERTLALPYALPPMRGWAGSPDFLLVVANEVLRRKPSVVMECSSGVSTIVVARCLQLNGKGHVYSLEHDALYAAKSRDSIHSYGLQEWATVIHAPLETRRTDTPWYAEDAIPASLEPIDILVVDGPPKTTAPLARLPALARLVHRMSANAIVIMDDADRDDEIEIVKRWKSLVPQSTETRPHCEKGCAILNVS